MSVERRNGPVVIVSCDCHQCGAKLILPAAALDETGTVWRTGEYVGAWLIVRGLGKNWSEQQHYYDVEHLLRGVTADLAADRGG